MNILEPGARLWSCTSECFSVSCIRQGRPFFCLYIIFSVCDFYLSTYSTFRQAMFSFQEYFNSSNAKEGENFFNETGALSFQMKCFVSRVL